MDWRRAN